MRFHNDLMNTQSNILFAQIVVSRFNAAPRNGCKHSVKSNALSCHNGMSWSHPAQARPLNTQRITNIKIWIMKSSVSTSPSQHECHECISLSFAQERDKLRWIEFLQSLMLVQMISSRTCRLLQRLQLHSNVSFTFFQSQFHIQLFKVFRSNTAEVIERWSAWSPVSTTFRWQHHFCFMMRWWNDSSISALQLTPCRAFVIHPWAGFLYRCQECLWNLSSGRLQT